MNTRWINPHQPQTLQIAVLLLYLNAVFLVIDLAIFGIFLFLIVAFVAGGWGIANEKKWGYIVALVASIVQVLILVAWVGFGQIFGNLGVTLTFMFNVALVALLAHPQSRDYQRIWFK